MKRVIEFLSDLNLNNNKVWFDAHKGDYKDVKAYFDGFVLDLVEAISDFDETIYGLSVSDCTYRIYRDVRFSKDKTPYKTHMGAYKLKNKSQPLNFSDCDLFHVRFYFYRTVIIK